MVPHVSDAMDRPSDIQNRYSQHALYVLYHTKKLRINLPFNRSASAYWIVSE